MITETRLLYVILSICLLVVLFTIAPGTVDCDGGSGFRTMYAIDQVQPDHGPLFGGTEVLVYANHTMEWNANLERETDIG